MSGERENLTVDVLCVLQVEPEGGVCIIPGVVETVPDQHLHQRGHECEGGRTLL